MQLLTLNTIEEWLRERASGFYGGEQVTQLQHALQCAALAQADGAAPNLVVAALLHDIAHLAPDTDDRKQPHEKLGAAILANLFPLAVTEPVRLHVDAKRYLCAVDPAYWEGLSEASRRSLEWQGGPFSPVVAAGFMSQPFAADAVRLRRWDDAAKQVGCVTPPLGEYLALLRSCALEPVPT